MTGLQRIAWGGSALMLSASSLFASNGTHLIGLSAASTGMGGTGVAFCANATDAIYKNPACLASLDLKAGQGSAEFNGNFVKLNTTADNSGLGFKSNQSGVKFLPALAGSYRVNDSLSVALGLYNYGGAAIDYTGEVSLRQIKSYKQQSKLAPSVAYKVDMFEFGLTPFLTYGELAINLDNGPGTAQSTREPHGATGVGVQVGASAHPIDNLSVGVSYTSKARVGYKGIIDLDSFGPSAAALSLGKLDDLNVEYPAEIAAGISYALMNWRFSFDYRNIGWGSADVFSELGWENQNVFAVGAQYAYGKEWKFRGGFNYAASQSPGTTGENGLGTTKFQGHTIFKQSLSLLNMVAFPAVSQSHFTLGAAYQLGDEWTFDLSGLFAPTVTVVRSGTGISPAGSPGAYAYTGTMSQWQVSAGATYKF